MNRDDNSSDSVHDILSTTTNDAAPVDEKRLGEIGAAGLAAHGRAWRMRRIKRWGLSAAAAMVMILGFFAFLSHNEPAYAWADVAKQIGEQKILHWKIHVTYASGSELIEETWADFPNLRHRGDTTSIRMVDGERKIRRIESVAEGEKSFAVFHEEKGFISSTRSILSQKIWLEIRRQEMLAGVWLGPGGFDAGFEKKGVEKIGDIQCDLWQASIPGFSDGKTTDVRAWVSREQREIIRVIAQTRESDGVSREQLDILPPDANEKFEIKAPEGYVQMKSSDTETRVPEFLGSYSSSAFDKLMPVFLLPDGSLIVGWSRSPMEPGLLGDFKKWKPGDREPSIPESLFSARIVRADGNSAMRTSLVAVTQSTEGDNKTEALKIWMHCVPSETINKKNAYRYEITLAGQNLRPSILFPIRDKKDFDELVVGTLTQWNDAGAIELDYDQIMKQAKAGK